MKRRIYLLLLGVFLVYACRSENDVSSFENETTSVSKKFSTFSQKKLNDKNNSEFNYAKGFARLAQKYDSVNSKNISGLVNTKNKIIWDSSSSENFIDESYEPYIEFRIHSQIIIEKNNDKWMIFPKITNSNVSDLVFALLSENESKLYYYILNHNNELYKNNIQLFQNRYKNQFMVGSNNKVYSLSSSKCIGSEGNPCEDIGEIIIHPRGGNYSGAGGIGEPSGGGGCPIYLDCENNDGGAGGSGENNGDNNADPCDNLKMQSTNANYKAKIAELDKNSVLNQKKETGYSENKSGHFSSLENSSSTNSSDGLSLPIDSNTKGFIHTHQNDYESGKTDEYGNPEERQPIRMFSPADVNALMKIAYFCTDNNYAEIYGTMISSYGNYTIKFTGTAADIKTGFDTEDWRKSYKKFMSNENGSLEKKFLRFLSEKMNVRGISLYKIKDNGVIQNKTLDPNNNVQSTDCP